MPTEKHEEGDEYEMLNAAVAMIIGQDPEIVCHFVVAATYHHKDSPNGHVAIVYSSLELDEVPSFIGRCISVQT